MGLTGEEIGRLTPWEVEQRAKGYARRLKSKKAFTASFVTAPIINGGYRAPKHPPKGWYLRLFIMTSLQTKRNTY